MYGVALLFGSAIVLFVVLFIIFFSTLKNFFRSVLFFFPLIFFLSSRSVYSFDVVSFHGHNLIWHVAC